MSSPQKSTGSAESKKAAPPSGSARAESRGILGSVVRIERLIQLALVLPAATFIGWAIGLGLDHWMHHHWISIAGLIFGAVVGFVEIFRVVANLSKE